MLFRSLLAVVAVVAIACGRPQAPVIHAAASTRAVVEALVADLDPRPIVDAGSTSTLVQQVQAGAGGAVLISAHPDWTAALETSGLARQVRPVASNRLVLVGPAGTHPTVDDLDRAACVVLGDPSHVPVGRYAREALTAWGRWPAVEGRVRPALDARAGAAAIAAGTCPVGVLYATDATAAGVSAGAPLPDAVQPVIRYDAVLLDPAAVALFDHLTGPAARAVWAAHGFGPP